MRLLLRTGIAILALLPSCSVGRTVHFPPPLSLGPVESYGQNIQRTMGLLANSTAQKRNTVRVLFYGQSITEQYWSAAVADDLRRRFPYANLIVENRALGGHGANLLVETAEADLYPFYPDLVVFQVYGSPVDYETIVRRVRERTTAEVLIQTDHISPTTDPIDDETALARPTTGEAGPWRNRTLLPRLAREYGLGLADVRGLWKRYLSDYGLDCGALLRDEIHLNDHGNYLMAEIVKAHLLHRPGPSPAARDDCVRTFEVGTDISWTDGKLALDWDGNRVDLICRAGSAPPAPVLVDGRKPSSFPECYAVTRTTVEQHYNWPYLLRIDADTPRHVEDWTLTVTEAAPDGARFKFRVSGSVTGADGEGDSTVRFRSRSGRAVVEAKYWNTSFMAWLYPNDPLPLPYPIRWKVVPLHADEFVAPASVDPTTESAVTVAQGLPNGRHRLEVLGGPDTPIAAVRVYRPPLRRPAP